jgi:antagonist of KipI
VNIFEVLRSGPLSTVQDFGRFGYSRYGVPPAGAMDTFALEIGNILVGNSRSTAGLEMTVVGIKARFLRPTCIAITGGTGSFTLNGQNISCWRCILIEPGDVLDIGSITAGCRTYLTLAGGITVSDVLGSKSTYLPAHFGGWKGRTLRRGDLLPGLPLPEGRTTRARKLAYNIIPDYSNNCTVRVICGPNMELFSDEMREIFYTNSYVITYNSDRMGYRLQGPSLKSKQTGNLLSNAVVTGTIQVPPDGQPIILAADHQTTGGYPILGVIAGIDFPKVAQLGIGKKLSFQAISLEEAQSLLREQEQFLHTLDLLVQESR